MQLLAGLRCQDVLEADHDVAGAPADVGFGTRLAVRQTGHQRALQFLVHSADDFRMAENGRPGLGKIRGLPMQAEQVLPIAPGWSKDPAQRWGRLRAAGLGLVSGGKRRWRQRDEAPATGSDGSLMQAFPAAMQHDLAGLERQSAPYQRASRVGRE